MLDAEFLAGFIALRRLNDPAAATRHFTTLADLSKAAITQGRAHYWLGRAAAAAGGDPKPEYQRAAAWATTFYGQLAALALGDDAAALARRINALHDPAYTRDQVLAFTDREVVRAAAMLVAWNDPHRARAFLLRMDELAPDPADRALTARFALRLGLPDTAVFVARRMGRDGLALPEAGWPIAAEPPDGPVDRVGGTRPDPPGEQLRHRRGQPVGRARADAAHAAHRAGGGEADRHRHLAGRR